MLNNIEYVHEEEHALKGPSKTAPWMTFNKENYPDSQKCIDLCITDQKGFYYTTFT